MLRIRIPLIAAALAAASLTADGQPPGFEPPPSRPAAVDVLPYVGDKNLAAELKLTEGQTSKLTAHRKKEWDAAYTTPPAEFNKTQADRNKATAALLKEVLEPEQYVRATQLMAQEALRSYRSAFGGLRGFGGFGPGGPGGPPAPPMDLVRIPATTLRTYPEIAEAVKLTAEQKKIVEAPTPPFGGGFGGGFGGPGGGGGRFGGPISPTEPRVVLTPDQTEALKRFLGPVSTVRFRMAFDQRGQLEYYGGGGFGGDDVLGTLTYRPVQTELKLTDEQIRGVSDLQVKTETFYGEEANNLSPEKAAARERELLAEAEKELARLLTKEQAARLKQIQVWMQIGPNTDAISRYQVRAVSEGVGLTEAQRKSLAEITAAHHDAVAKAFDAELPVDELRKKLDAADESRDAAVEKLITADQKAKLKDLLGAEFKDSRFGGGPVGGDLNEILKRMRTASFGRYTGELTTLAMQVVRDDLKLTDEQVKKANEALTTFQQKFQGGGFPGNQTQEEADKAALERHEFIAKALADILTAEQRKRFRELVIQYREQVAAAAPGVLNTTTSGVGLPGVADELKITADQKRKLLDGSDPADVLTADQQVLLKKLAGEPAKGAFLIAGRGSPRVRASTRVSLLDTPPVADELKLTPEQRYRVGLALEAYATALRDPNRRPPAKGKGDRPSAAELRKAQDAALAACEKALDAVLTPEQRTRLAQLEVQTTPTLTAAFALPAVAEKLALTADQKAKLETIRADYRERTRLASARSPRGFGGPVFQSYGDVMTKLREKARERTLAVLTDAQKAAWTELNGEPSKVLPWVGPFGGFGPRGTGIDP
jgi:hypothetical protein